MQWNTILSLPIKCISLVSSSFHHFSQLDAGRVGRVEDAVRVGDEVLVKVLGVDEKGRLSLSRRAALKQMEGRAPEAGPSSGSAQRPRH